MFTSITENQPEYKARLEEYCANDIKLEDLLRHNIILWQLGFYETRYIRTAV